MDCAVKLRKFQEMRQRYFPCLPVDTNSKLMNVKISQYRGPAAVLCICEAAKYKESKFVRVTLRLHSGMPRLWIVT